MHLTITTDRHVTKYCKLTFVNKQLVVDLCGPTFVAKLVNRHANKVNKQVSRFLEIVEGQSMKDICC